LTSRSFSEFPFEFRKVIQRSSQLFRFALFLDMGFEVLDSAISLEI